MGEKKPLQAIGFPSTELEGATFTDDGGDAHLQLSVEDDEGDLWVEQIDFLTVRAYRMRAESHCTVWHIEDAYDTLVEVEESEWVAELTEATPEDLRGRFVMRHFMIYLDSVGCFEVVAEDWGFVPRTVTG